MTYREIGSLSAAGLFAGVFAWTLQQQAGYVTASWACGKAGPGIWLAAALALLILLGGGLISLLALHRPGATPERMRPRRFIAMVSLMAAALFLFAIGLQAAAALFLPGCIG